MKTLFTLLLLTSALHADIAEVKMNWGEFGRGVGFSQAKVVYRPSTGEITNIFTAYVQPPTEPMSAGRGERRTIMLSADTPSWIDVEAGTFSITAVDLQSFDWIAYAESRMWPVGETSGLYYEKFDLPGPFGPRFNWIWGWTENGPTISQEIIRTYVPEPSSLVLLGIGMLILGKASVRLPVARDGTRTR